MLRVLSLNLLISLACLQGHAQQYPSYEILGRDDTSIHYFIHLPRADSTGWLTDTLFVLPADPGRSIYLSFQGGGTQNDVYISGSNEIKFNTIKDCDGGIAGLLPLFGHISFGLHSAKEKSIRVSAAQKGKILFIHYLSCNYGGYFRIQIQ